MAKSPNQKLKLLYLYQILLQRTDEEHPITVPQLIGELDLRGIRAERKSVYDDLEALRLFGLDVQSRKGRSPGWFVGRREFELPELKLLVDAVQSSRFIIYYNVDKLHTALSARKSITFRYFDYDMHRNKVFRREGRRYAVSPYGLIWNSENYYLVAYDISNQEMRHYRVDKMAEIVVTGLPREGEDRYPDFDVAAYGQKHFGMYSGEEASVTLRCRSHMAGVVWDRFGQDVILVPEDEDHFTVTLPLVLSPQFFGWLFGLEDNVELIAPQKAAEEYRRKLKAVLEQYG